jgi:hypothetical protein
VGGYVWRDVRRLPAEMWRNLREKPDLGLGILLVLAAGVALHWLATGLEDWILKLLEGQRPAGTLVWFTAASAVLAPAAALAAWADRHVFRELHVRYRIESAQRPRPYLVLFVSSQRPPLLGDGAGEVPEDGPVKLSDGKGSVTLERKDLLADARALDGRMDWNWEMLLRGLAPHARGLYRLHLVGSADTPTKPGSSHDLKTAARLLAPYLVAAGRAATVSGAANLIKAWPEPVDFEDFKAVHSALEQIRRQLDLERAGDRELCVDITGGQKPTSAAAGTFTMNKDVVLQYVQTNPPKESHVFDVRFLSAPEGNE